MASTCPATPTFDDFKALDSKDSKEWAKERIKDWLFRNISVSFEDVEPSTWHQTSTLWPLKSLKSLESLKLSFQNPSRRVSVQTGVFSDYKDYLSSIPDYLYNTTTSSVAINAASGCQVDTKTRLAEYYQVPSFGQQPQQQEQQSFGNNLKIQSQDTACQLSLESTSRPASGHFGLKDQHLGPGNDIFKNLGIGPNGYTILANPGQEITNRTEDSDEGFPLVVIPDIDNEMKQDGNNKAPFILDVDGKFGHFECVNVQPNTSYSYNSTNDCSLGYEEEEEKEYDDDDDEYDEYDDQEEDYNLNTFDDDDEDDDNLTSENDLAMIHNPRFRLYFSVDGKPTTFFYDGYYGSFEIPTDADYLSLQQDQAYKHLSAVDCLQAVVLGQPQFCRLFVECQTQMPSLEEYREWELGHDAYADAYKRTRSRSLMGHEISRTFDEPSFEKYLYFVKSRSQLEHGQGPPFLPRPLLSFSTRTLSSITNNNNIQLILCDLTAPPFNFVPMPDKLVSFCYVRNSAESHLREAKYWQGCAFDGQLRRWYSRNALTWDEFNGYGWYTVTNNVGRMLCSRCTDKSTGSKSTGEKRKRSEDDVNYNTTPAPMPIASHKRTCV